MKEKLTNNLLLKIASVMCAAVLWFVVINIEDPVISKEFSNIPVTYLNEKVITDQGLYWEAIEGDPVTVVVKAPYSVIKAIKTSDFSAVADFNGLSSYNNSMPITVTIPKYEDKITELRQKTYYVIIETENYDEKKYPITVEVTGTPTEGYAIGDYYSNPSSVTVSGPQSEIEKIAKIVASVDVAGISKNINQQVALKYYDSDGNQIKDTSKIVCNYAEAEVGVTMLKTKNVGISIDIPENNNITYTIEPEYVTIAGSADTLAGISYIYIPEAALDIDSITEDMDIAIDISRYLPDNVKLADTSASTVLINFYLEDYTSKKVEFEVSDIKITNLSDNMRLNYSSTDSITVTVKGLEGVLSSFVSSSLEPYIDVSGLSAGSHNINIMFELPAGVTISEDYYVDIVLTETVDTDETSSEQTTTTAPVQPTTAAETTVPETTTVAESSEEETDNEVD